MTIIRARSTFPRKYFPPPPVFLPAGGIWGGGSPPQLAAAAEFSPPGGSGSPPSQISAEIPPESPPDLRFGRTELKFCRFSFLAVPNFTPPSVFRRFRKKIDFEKFISPIFYKKTKNDGEIFFEFWLSEWSWDYVFGGAVNLTDSLSFLAWGVKNILSNRRIYERISIEFS